MKETFRQQAILLNDRFNSNPKDYQLSMEDRQRAIRELVPPRIIAQKTKAYCSHCGSQIRVLTQKECPVCHTKWRGETKHVDRPDRYREYEYLCVMDVIEGLQVMRFWCVGYWFHPGRQTVYDVTEVQRQFICEDGSRQGAALSIPQHYRGQYDAWAWSSKITIKDLNPKYHGYYGDITTPRFNLPCQLTIIKRLIPMLRRNGLRKSTHGVWYPAGLVLGLLKQPALESLWKQKQYAAVNYQVRGTSHYDEEILNSIRICTRHGYRIKDMQMWLDHVRLLGQINLDIRNPHYICPDNLQRAHNALNNRINHRRQREQKRLRKEQYFRQLSKMDKEKVTYVERWGKLLSLSLKTRNLRIRPLQSVDEFVDEALAMNHCVFSAGYYKSKKSLILSAKDAKGKRLATIEYNVTRGTIEQCRAENNLRPARDKTIRQLIDSNRQTFLKLRKAA